MGSPQPPGVTGHPNGVSSPPARLQTLSLSHFPISLLAIIELSHAEGWCCVEVGPWEWLYPVPLPVPSFWGAGVSTLGPLGLGCRNGACPPSIGSAAWGPPDTSGGSSRRGTFTWKTACQHLPWPPSQDGGGGGQRGARGAMMSHGKRKQEEAGCLRAACLPSAQDTATAGKSATFLETFFKADQRCREATAKQQQLMIPIPLGPVSLAGLPPPTPGCLWGPWQSRVLSWQPLAPRWQSPVKKSWVVWGD